MSETLTSFPNREPVLFAGIMATLLLGSAFAFQLAGYPPCELCWWQRYPYMAVMAVSLIATGMKSLPRKWVLVLLALLFATDAGIAAFHFGVEQRWWEGLATCSSYVDVTDSVDDALKAIMDAPLIRCDEIAWSLFGISMAGYNFLIALGMTAFCALKAKDA
ncbi:MULTISPECIES: disulfide bond formation protein B [Kordiimonas]|jgi:disulfide bond formation protein DsbB|uniref:Disulfide bond formation protein DsbB n=1 Tax=Kordiimonas lacus TaxID=637679 RepID=A0A1G6XUV3_9PROT|nr:MULTISPECIES: disulfide bond formation protein B [Kordiimonas]SDD81217.1 Disulfide bond formation protein DsbB [Kordiimonas lacus]